MTNIELFLTFYLTFLTICVIIVSIFAISASISVKAIEKSTHSVEYVPLDPKWASTDKEISEINEKSEMEYPEIDEDELGPSEIDLNKMI